MSDFTGFKIHGWIPVRMPKQTQNGAALSALTSDWLLLSLLPCSHCETCADTHTAARMEKTVHLIMDRVAEQIRDKLEEKLTLGCNIRNITDLEYRLPLSQQACQSCWVQVESRESKKKNDKQYKTHRH